MGQIPSKNRIADTDLSDDSESYSRRSICRAATVSALPFIAGCSDITGFLNGNPGEVTVFNDTGSELTASITVTKIAEEETVLSETADISASEAAKFNDVFDAATQYRFEAETDDGQSDSYEWDLPSTDHYLYITINSGGIEFEENSP